LLLLNDPQYVEAARALAARVMRERTTERDRAGHMYRLCTARQASEETLAELMGLYEDQLDMNQRQETAATEPLGAEQGKPGEEFDSIPWAAWTVVANLMLNLDEVINSN
jgi:hypothetical protein